MTDKLAEVIWVSGPVMRSSGGQFLSMYETVEVGAARLIGEVIALDGEVATLQIYEDTGGIRPGPSAFLFSPTPRWSGACSRASWPAVVYFVSTRATRRAGQPTPVGIRGQLSMG